MYEAEFIVYLMAKRGIDISKHIKNSSTNAVLVDVTGEVENIPPVAVANPEHQPGIWLPPLHNKILQVN